MDYGGKFKEHFCEWSIDWSNECRINESITEWINVMKSEINILSMN